VSNSYDTAGSSSFNPFYNEAQFFLFKLSARYTFGCRHPEMEWMNGHSMFQTEQYIKP
jgi:hypothetical protein